MSLASRLEFIEKLRRDSLLYIVPKELSGSVKGSCRDKRDDVFLALCRAARADILVSSDHDLLVLHPWQGIQILKPAQFLAEFAV